MYWLLTSAGKIFSGGRYEDDVGKKNKKKKQRRKILSLEFYGFYGRH